jgi:hypothetical protein
MRPGKMGSQGAARVVVGGTGAFLTNRYAVCNMLLAPICSSGMEADMTRKPLLLCLLLALIGPNLFAASELDRELTKLVAEKDKAIADATEPIKKRHRESLNLLLKKAVAAGDLETAVKIKALLADGSSKANHPIVGTWKSENEVFEFSAGGKYQSDYLGTSPEGRWIVVSENEVKVTFTKTGKIHNFRVSEDGKFITRLQDGKKWPRKE